MPVSPKPRASAVSAWRKEERERKEAETVTKMREKEEPKQQQTKGRRRSPIGGKPKRTRRNNIGAKKTIPHVITMQNV